MAKLWNEGVLKGDDLRRAQHEINDAMRGVVADALRGRPLGRGVLPEEHRAGEGVPTRNGVPLRVLEELEAAEKAKQDLLTKQIEWERFREAEAERFRQAQAREPWLTWKNLEGAASERKCEKHEQSNTRRNHGVVLPREEATKARACG